ncbi:MAG: PAC2 family protein [Deltaproteobacteria bacterium]|nr:PAC2 family protein [Deltaproteobacteria bacterium]
MKSVKLYCEPELVNPCLIAAWPGVGNVASIAATYLKDKLQAEELGELEPAGFFDPGGVFIKDNLIDTPGFPDSKFYYWKSEGQGNAIIIFIAEAQPASRAYDYAGTVLDVAGKFGVNRVYTIAAALTEHHPEQPRVLVAASSQELLDQLKSPDVVMAGDFYIAGLNGLLLGAARERGMEGIAFLGETVKYAAKVANPRASLEVLKVLTGFIGINIDLTELEDYADGMEKQIKHIGNEMKREFLQNFTKPIWEREKTEGNG